MFFKTIELLRNIWTLRVENQALRRKVEELERGGRPRTGGPGNLAQQLDLAKGERERLQQELAQKSSELANARARLARIREVIHRVRHEGKGVVHAGE